MRTKRSVYNVIVKLLQGTVPNVLMLFLNQRIIQEFGSDVNGILSTAAQVVNFLTIFDAGFSMSAIVVLYAPYLEGDTGRVNAILAATGRMFTKVGRIVVFLGAAVSAAIPFVLKSEVDPNLIRAIFLVSVANVAFSFFFTIKYGIMFSVAQKEYKQTLFAIAFQVAAQAACLVAIGVLKDILAIRVILFAVPMLGLPVLVLVHRREFKGIHFKSPELDMSGVKKAKDVFVQKVAVLVANSLDVFLISAFLGAVYSSVYTIYYFIYSGIKQLLFSFVLAPFNAFGQLIAAKDGESLGRNYRTYAYVCSFVTNVLVTTANQLIIPFIAIYASGIHDAEYSLPAFAMAFSLCIVLEIVSNMVGVVLNSGGWFAEVKPIVVVSSAIKLGLSLALIPFVGIYAVIVASIASYVYMDVGLLILLARLALGPRIGYLARYAGINAAASVALTIGFALLHPRIDSYGDFALMGMLMVAVNGLALAAVNWAIDANEARRLLERFLRALRGVAGSRKG